MSLVLILAALFLPVYVENTEMDNFPIVFIIISVVIIMSASPVILHKNNITIEVLITDRIPHL